MIKVSGFNPNPNFGNISVQSIQSSGNLTVPGVVTGNANVSGNISAQNMTMAGNTNSSSYQSGSNVGITANVVIPAVANLRIVSGIIVGIV